MTLTEFLLARIAEDDANAPAPSRPMPSDADYVHAMCGDCGGCSQARWLAECEAKRRIATRIGAGHPDAAPELNKIIALLAAVYSDHPDYDPAWRP